MLPSLHCLHIIGRVRDFPTEDNIEGLLVNVLARHASVLTLQLRPLKMPLTLPNLQHLVLDLGRDMLEHYSSGIQMHQEVFPAISTLKGLKTLYIQSNCADIEAPNLKNCVCLQHVAIKGIRLQPSNSSPELVLPAECQLHANFGDDLLCGYCHDFTGVTIRSKKSYYLETWIEGGVRFGSLLKEINQPLVPSHLALAT